MTLSNREMSLIIDALNLYMNKVRPSNTGDWFDTTPEEIRGIVEKYETILGERKHNVNTI